MPVGDVFIHVHYGIRKQRKNVIKKFRRRPLRYKEVWRVVCSIIMSHRNVQPHVSLNEVVCYRTERTLMGFADPSKYGMSHTGES